MDIRRLSDEYSVTAQPDPDDMPGLAEKGFKSVLIARPDGEDAGQADAAAITAGAEAAGLAVRHVPVSTQGMTQQDLLAFVDAMEELDKPVIGYCRSGGRAAALYEKSASLRAG